MTSQKFCIREADVCLVYVTAKVGNQQLLDNVDID